MKLFLNKFDNFLMKLSGGRRGGVERDRELELI